MLFRIVLFELQIFQDFPVVFLLNSSLIPLWSENILSMISILLNVLSCFNGQHMSILVSVPFELEKNLYFTVLE